jgi:hypothetical protein
VTGEGDVRCSDQRIRSGQSRAGADENQHLVEALTSNGAHEALGERIRARGLNGRADDPGRLGSEHLIETRAELGIGSRIKNFLG